MGKVFGYPKWSEDGEQIVTEYQGDYEHMMMDIRLFRMKTGDVKCFKKPEEETAILLLQGKLTLCWAGQKKQVSRKDVWTEGLWCLHVCRDTEVSIQADSDDVEILVQSTHNNRDFPAKLYGPEDIPWEERCHGKYGDTAKRKVTTIFDYETAPYSNMVLGEIMNDPGNWCGYLPHSHPQPELYYFKFERPEGFGASFVGEDVYYIKDGSFSAIPGGKTHPQSAAPGYRMYIIWMIRHFDDNPWTVGTYDERFTWLDEV